MHQSARVASLVAGCLVIGLSTPSRADIILDQSNVVPGPAADYAVVTSQSLAQTFTVGLAGPLAEVDLQISKNTGATGDLTFTIRTTSGGVPNPNDGQSLFQTVIPLSSIPTIDSPFTATPLTAIDVSSAGIVVTPGEVLTLALSRTGPGTPPWAQWRSGPDVYPGGAEYQRSSSSAAWTPITLSGVGQDAGFRTFVGTASVPEPSPLALTGVLGSLGGLTLWRRRKAA